MTTRPATFGALRYDEIEDMKNQPPMVCKRCGALTPPISPNSHERGTFCANCEDRQHRQRMINFAKKKEKPLTPEQLAEAIQDLKKKHPEDFPK